MTEKFRKLFFNTNVIFWCYVIITLVITIDQYLGGEKIVNDHAYTHYNNFIIFRQSFYHLIHNQPLYNLWPAEHWDFYKYSPTFSMFMAPFAFLPDLPGLSIWNLLNTLCLFFAIKNIAAFDEKKKQIMLWFILPEIVVSLHNSQSNGLMAALLIAAFNYSENKRFLVAAILIGVSVYIKIFGLAAFALFIFYPERWKAIFYGAIVMIVFAFLPLLITSAEQLKLQYDGWLSLLQADQAAPAGLSVSGWLKSWFHFEPSEKIIMLTGIIMFCIPFFKIKNYSSLNYRLLTLSALLIWVIIFNHRAESPTFIIAICGAAIWYLHKARNQNTFEDNPRSNFNNRIDLVLLILAFILSSLSPTDLFPRFIRKTYMVPYMLKTVPFILIWLKIFIEQMFYPPAPRLRRTRPP